MTLKQPGSHRVNASTNRGAIHNREKYMREKCIDHSGWFGLLPRNGTPSDIDGALDNAGHVLLFEYSDLTSNWNDYTDGQHRLYRAFVAAGRGLIACMGCHHVTQEGADIDSRRNIIAAEIMSYDPEETVNVDGIIYTRLESNQEYEKFVVDWFSK